MKGSRNSEQVGRAGEVLTLSPINFTYFSHIINIRKKAKEFFKSPTSPRIQAWLSAPARCLRTPANWLGFPPCPLLSGPQGLRAAAAKPSSLPPANNLKLQGRCSFATKWTKPWITRVKQSPEKHDQTAV